MGLFGGLFDKKVCVNCGSEAGRIFNYKIADGILCKECSGKLSPWYRANSKASLEFIQEQLAYREANEAALASFNPTLTCDAGHKIMIDEGQRKFIVTDSRNWRSDNPDLIDLNAITGCDYDIEETRREIEPDEPEGTNTGSSTSRISMGVSQINSVAHRYEYEYDFTFTIHVNHPYFDEISFRVNDFTIEQRYSAEYSNCERICEEAKQLLLSARSEVRAEAAAAAAPKMASTCPHCGATCIPDASGCCEYCGGAMLQA